MAKKTDLHQPRKTLHSARIFFCACLSGLLLFLPANTKEKTYRLAFSKETGENLRYQYSFTIKRIQEVSGRETKAETSRTTEAIIGYSMDGRDKAGNILISLWFDSLNIQASSPRGKQSADTQRSLGIPVKYKLNPRGDVLETMGLESLPEIPDFNTRGEYDLKSILIRFPGKEIKLNDTWTGEWLYESKTSAGWQRNTFTTVYRALEEVQKFGLACLRIETLTKEKIEGRQEFQGRAAALSGEADLKGEVIFAYKEGIIVEKSYVEDGGKLVMEITSPQAITIINTNYAKASFFLIR